MCFKWKCFVGFVFVLLLASCLTGVPVQDPTSDPELVQDWNVAPGQDLFDGIEDVVVLENDVIDTTQSYTIEAWVRLSKTGDRQSIVSQDCDTVSGFNLVKTGKQGSFDANRFAFSIPESSSGGNIIRVVSQTEPIIGRWYHLVAVHNADTQEIQLYVNGEWQDSEAFTTPWASTGETVIGRGQWNGNPSNYFSGNINQVRFYSTPFTSGDVSHQYQNSDPPSTPNTAYLMAFFTSGEEKLFYAYSFDGLGWTPINDGEPVFNAYSNRVRLRDPFIQKVTHNGETKFHLVHTKGWDNEEIFHWESLDGITWTGVNGGKKTRDGEIQAVPEGTAPNAWAPEFFYDSDSSIFYIFWSTREYDGVDHQRILYRTTSDWRTFSEPQVLLDPGFGVIDLTVMQRDGMFFGVYKLEEKLDEGIETSSHNQKRLLLAQGDSFTLLYGITDFLPSVRGVEGPQFLLVDENQVRLYYDFFANGNGWGASATDSLTTWEPLDGGMVQFPSDVRHGSATSITLAELTTILQYFEDELPPELR